MSTEEDTELRDLVAQTLESKGVLGKIRAQLRASVFLALEEQEGTEGRMPLANPGLKTFLSTNEGRLVTGLVREFLEYFDLDFSIAVFDPETNFSDKYPGRNNLARELKLSDAESSASTPLLAEVIKHLSPSSAAEKTTTRDAAVTSPRHSATGSPRSTSPPMLNKVDDEDFGELSPDSNDSMPSSPRPSKIPQRVKDEKSSKSDRSLSPDSFLDKLGSNKEQNSLSESRKENSGKRSPDVTIGSDDDDDIFADFPSKKKNDAITSRRKENDKTLVTNEPGSKPSTGLSSLKGAPPLGSTTLGSLKGVPPLPGMNNNRDVSKSPNWKDLAEIDSRINKLGFDIPDEDRNGGSPDYNDDYEDDFIATSDHSMSIPEDIDEQFSLGSFHSGSAKLDDLLTTDRTVSQASVGDLDFAEDVLNF